MSQNWVVSSTAMFHGEKGLHSNPDTSFSVHRQSIPARQGECVSLPGRKLLLLCAELSLGTVVMAMNQVQSNSEAELEAS